MFSGKNPVKIIAAILSFVMLLSVAVTVSADNSRNGTNPNRKTVRIGFPIQSKLTYKTDSGEFTGYNAEYLREVVKYTNWDIEYVEAEGDLNAQLTTLVEMLDNGEIDMLGTMVMNDALQEMYLYPTYSYGNTYTALTVTEDSNYWITSEFTDWDGIKIATYPGLEKRMALLEQFAKVSGFTYDTVECETLQEVIDKVHTGEADACLQVDINIEDGFRAIARFSPNPYYFAINKQRMDLLKELNTAMYSLLESYPSLQSELYSKYFMNTGSFHISDDDREWVAGLPTLRVLYFTGNTPIQNITNGVPSGVAASFMEQFCKATGLKTTPVFADSFAEGEDLVKKGEVDLIAAITNSSSLNTLYNVRLSNPYFESSSVRINVSSSESDAPAQYFASNSEYALNNLKYGTYKAANVDAYCADYYMRKGSIYKNLYAEWANRDLVLYSVGLLSTVDDRLAGIISGFANSLNEQERQSMLYAASQQPLSYNLEELTEIYWWQILTAMVAVIMLAILLLHRRRSRIVRESAKDAEQLFLFSRMVNECLIRYDVEQDRLMMQNSRIVFSEREILQPFLKASTDTFAQNENERRCVDLLKKMLGGHNTTSELQLEEDGSPIWYRIDLVYINFDCAIGRMYNIEDEVEKREKLERKANVDSLTGIMNRSAMQQYIDDYLQNNRNGVFLLLDLDNFKLVNDTMGHIEGDKLLQKFAEYLETVFRNDDLKARLGGDEFVVFMTTGVPSSVLRKKLDMFMQDISQLIFKDYQSCQLSVSIGAAYISDSCHSFEQLYKDADSAMYNAKKHGKNRYYIAENQ